MKRKWIGLMICFLAASTAFGQDSAQIQEFSPRGLIKDVRQVRVRFSDQMVPFGDPRHLADPFDIDCPEKGAGRWADGRNWIYDFDRNLPAGTRCAFHLKEGVKTLSGKAVSGLNIFDFHTGGPSIHSDSLPFEGNTVDEDQIFILLLNGEADPDSIRQHVFFSIDGIENRIGVRIVEGKDREKILKTQNRYAVWLKEKQLSSIVLIQCRQRFPADTRISLIWGSGVKSRSGIANEQDQVLHFRSREPFTVEFSCARESPAAGCIPVSLMRLYFSAPISKAQASRIVLQSTGVMVSNKAKRQDIDSKPALTAGKGGKTVSRIWKPRPAETEGDVYGVPFDGPFPENMNFVLKLPPDIKDNAGRVLVNADNFPLTIRTGAYPPLAKFSGRFGILELKANAGLPVTLRHLEPSMSGRKRQIDQVPDTMGKVVGKIVHARTDRADNLQSWLRRVANASRDKSVFSQGPRPQKFTLPKPHGGKAFEVVGIPMNKAGLYIVELESAVLGKALLAQTRPLYVPTAVLVTNLSAHFKWGRESSLVWVTTLDEGKPVANAAVAIRDCREKILWQGRTDASGISRVDGKLPPASELPQCRAEARFDGYYEWGPLDGLDGGLFVTARTKDDLTFVHSSWDQGIEPWRFQLPYDLNSGEPYSAHTIFDRTLLRAGDMVHMKHIFRRRTMSGFRMPAKDILPDTVLISHTGSSDKYELPVKWRATDNAETGWTIPKDARLGTYEITLTRKDDEKKPDQDQSRSGRPASYEAGQFRVEEFRVPLMKGTIQPPSEPLVNAAQVGLRLGVQYLAGGGAGLIPVKVRSVIHPRPFVQFNAFEDFIFGNGPVEEGLKRRGTAVDAEEGENVEEAVTPVGRGHGASEPPLPVLDVLLDKTGMADVILSPLPKLTTVRDILTEMEFMDPNGETQTVSAKIPLWPSAYMVGLKPDAWASAKDGLKFHAAVVDLKGHPVADAEVRVALFERKHYSHRKRLIGGFYAYEHVEETKKIAPVCEGRTDARGLLICEGKSPISGNVILEAQSADGKGRRTFAQSDVWVADKGDWWFDVGDNDRIDLLPEAKNYSPGQKAVFQVRMPFRSATALVSIEREGVMDAWVTHLSGTNPVIEVPVKASYAPNVFISALIVRGRVPGIKPTATVDMGKPAYKLGIGEINVGWKAHELKVNLSTDRQVYKVRQRAIVKIKATTADGGAPPAGSEVALAAVDEGLLELMPNASWNLLSAMMGRRAYEVGTASAQMQVIGKRHFGLKALPPGGGGGTGKQGTRELFDTLLIWRGSIPLDARGEAQAEIPLNDSITAFRIVAVATGGAGFFGTGSTAIRTTQDVMIFAGVPPLVREGDRYRAAFTLRNTSGRAIDADVMGKASGLKMDIPPLSASLNPSEAQVVGWDVTAPPGVEQIQWEVEIKEKGIGESDRIRVMQKVTPVTPVKTYQATILQVVKDIRMDVERPPDAAPGRGGVHVILKPNIADGLTGVVDYMKQYPYACLEQRISVAVALRDASLWRIVTAKLPAHLDTSGFAKYFPLSAHGSPMLTSYILAIAHEAGWEIPKASKERMQEALKGFIAGKYSDYSPLRTADLNIRKLAAIEALAREDQADGAMLNAIAIEPNLWPTSAVIDWFNILRRIMAVPDRDRRLPEAERILRSRLNFAGTRMGFSTERTDFLWWLMVSNDVNAVRLILSMTDQTAWRDDMPRLVQGALARQKKGAWDLTLANAWGVLAMEKFSAAFEPAPAAGTTQTSLGQKTRTVDWDKSAKGATHLYAWPAGKGTLHVAHQGAGRPWLTVQSLAAIPLKQEISSGYKIKRTIIPVDRKKAHIWSVGDILRIRLDLEGETDQTWVVVSDPVPAGSSILGKGLARDSQILTQDEERKGWVWPAFEERSFETFRAYYDYVPKGNWTVEYTIRLNSSGTFHLPATRVEALYFPEMFGEAPNKTMEVQP